LQRGTAARTEVLRRKKKKKKMECEEKKTPDGVSRRKTPIKKGKKPRRNFAKPFTSEVV